jgi:dipeptidyl aminopeptidase/acylaminoacyl peptidase/CubicO group peptidase (beta-lactamase class C family)
MTRHPVIEDLYDIALPEQPALSPDGDRIVYVLRTVDRAADRADCALWQVGTRAGEPRRLTRGGTDSAPAWSPDGTGIAFLRAGENAPAQLWLLPAAGGEAEQLTTLPLGAGAPVWSPDGTRIAFAAPVDTAANGDAEDARRASAAVVSDRLDYKADGAGLLRTMRSHVHVVEVAGHAVRQLTDGDWHAGTPAWSPDGTLLAFPAARDGDADLTFRSAAYVIDATSRTATPRRVGAADGQAGPLCWTADGAGLLVVGREDTRSGHAHLLNVTMASGKTVDLTATLDRNVMPGGPGYPGALPQQSGGTVLFCAREHGYTNLYATDSAGAAPRALVSGARNVSGLSVAGDTAVIVLATPTSYGEIAVVDVVTGALDVRTAHAHLDGVEPFTAAERQFAISDGTSVHGWLLRDPAATAPGPLLLDIHGGPHNAWNGAADPVHLYHQALVARGWSVLLLNPRGSDGYGEAFHNGALGAWGEADARDFLEPLDQLVAEGVADPKRLAVTGYSYGGYMTCYLTSRDDRFAAAVPGGVVVDLASMAGTSDAGHVLGVLELGGLAWVERARFAELSPITHVAAVNTPTLIVQGAADERCPVGQAEQWFTALRERGVPAQLILYPGASHLFILQAPPSQRADWNRRVFEWVERFAGDAAGPRPALIGQAHWQRRLARLAEAHRVPGAALGILRLGRGEAPDDVAEAAYGVLNKATGVEVTTDSVFQIGSMTKVWTATVVMRLVEAGRLDLDAPLIEVLPELRVADPDVTKQVTMRHLLTHTSGIDGDVFTDTGRGDDCLERYVSLLEGVGQNHPLGATWSYCNSGFSLAGRVIEKLTGTTWDQAMAEHVFAPLGMTRAVTLPEQALLHRAAVGHVGEGDAEPQPAPMWQLPRSLGPAGLVTCTAADALAFARLHLTGGLGPDGTRLLGADTVASMAAQHAELPDKYSLGDSWGLGWIRFGWDGHRLIGHDGNTIGQAAFLRVLPEAGLAVTLLTNGGNARDLYEDLFREIFAELAGVAMPRPLAPPESPVTADIAPHVGRYERAGVSIDVLTDGGTPHMRTTITGPLAAMVPEPTQEFDLVPVDTSGDLFAVREPGTVTWAPVTFYALATGERYLHFGVRATPRVG